ncbi:MAG TPA: transcriptional coactivator p15/PC4 family protein [Longimicrobiales bacterium]|nr:transcriptional coactivator p15/PC4 family protein [Longimicrobiales bacterium]
MVQTDGLIDARLIRGGREELRVELSDYRGHTYIGLRRWYQDGDEWKPGKGLSVSVDQIPFLRRAIVEAEQRAIALGALDPEAYEAINEPVPAEVFEAAA